MNNDTQRSGGNFSSGFLIGALVGAAVVFFLGTKKGKRILKVISEKGLDNVTNILEKVDKSTDLEEIFEEPSFASTFTETSADKKASEGQGKKLNLEEKSIEEKPHTKRFFRGISRRLN